MILELQFQKSPLRCLKTAVCGEQNQEQTQEIKLSDAMPDIGRVIGCWGQVILRGKEWQPEAVALNGGVMVWVLYAPEDGTEHRTLECWIPFQMKWDLPQGTKEGRIRGAGQLRSLDGRSVSPRKLMLRAVIAGWVEALVTEDVEVFHPGEIPGDVALLENTRPVTIAVQSGEKVFQLDEELPFPEDFPLPEKLVYYTLRPEILEKKVVGGRAVFRGNGVLHVLYISGDGRLHSRDFSLAFSQLGDVDGELQGDGMLDVTLGVTDLDVSLEEGHLRLKCGMTAQYLVEDRVMLTLTEDAYSPRRSLKPEMGKLDIPALSEEGWEEIPVEQGAGVDGEGVDAVFYPDFPRQRPGENGVQVELRGQFRLLYYTPEGTLRWTTARWEETHTIPAGENLHVWAQLRKSPWAVQGEGALRGECTLTLSYRATAGEGMPMVTGLTLGDVEEPDPERPSLILRRAGKAGLWELAKAAGSTLEAIREVNHLEKEPEEGKMLLIPVL